MKIYMLFSDDPIFKPKLLNKIILNSDCTIHGLGEVISPKRGNILIKLKYNIEFWGLWQFVFIAIEHIYYKFIDKLPLFCSINSLSSMKRVCHKHNIPYRRVINVNSKEFLNYLKKDNIDVILSFQHQIFKEDILNIPKITCINCHPALLPAYRGVKPVFWAMLNGEKEFGVTVHTMSKDIDCGKIISQKRIALNRKNTLFENYVVAYECSAYGIIEALSNLNKIDISILPDISNEGKYYGEPEKKDILRFRKMGLKTF